MKKKQETILVVVGPNGEREFLDPDTVYSYSPSRGGVMFNGEDKYGPYSLLSNPDGWKKRQGFQVDVMDALE